MSKNIKGKKYFTSPAGTCVVLQ